MLRANAKVNTTLGSVSGPFRGERKDIHFLRLTPVSFVVRIFEDVS